MTHTLIWFLENNTKLSFTARSIIENLDNEIFVSMASWFEIAIKTTIGKLELPDSISETMARSAATQIATLGILECHIINYQDFPLLEQHRDPFDRMIMATASAENLAVITSDPKFRLYDSLIQLVW